MDILFLAKITAFALFLAAAVYGGKTFGGETRIYLLAALFSLFGSSLLFFEFKDALSPLAIMFDWLKHIFVVFGMVAFYFFWTEWLKTFARSK